MSDKETKAEEPKSVSEILEEVKSQDYEMAVIVGLDKKGNVAVNATNNNLPMVHWMLNRAEFEMNLFEKNQRTVQEEQAAPEKKENKKSDSGLITPDSKILTP